MGATHKQAVKSLERFLDGFVSREESPETRRRVYLLVFVSLIGIVNLVPLGILAFNQGNRGLGTFDITLALILLANLLHSRVVRKYDINIAVGVFFTGLLFVYAFVTGGVNNSGFVWYFTFPLISLYTLGPSRGAAASAVMLLPVLVLFGADGLHPGLADYSRDFKIRFLPSYVAVLAFSYLFERSRKRFQEELARNNEALKKTIADLHTTEAELRESRQLLENRVAERTGELVAANRVLEGQIAERTRAEKELEFTNVILKTQQETSLDGVLVVGADGRIVSYNRRFQEIWGIPDSILAGKSDEETLSFVLDKLDDPEGFLSKVRHLYDSPEETSRDELRLKDERILDRYSAPMISAQGTNYGRVWYFRDITENRRWVEALRESEARHRALIAQATDSILILDPEGDEGPVIVETNEKACEEHGYTMEELVGMPIGRLDDAENAELVKQRVSALTTYGNVRFETMHVRKDGSTFPVEVSAGMLYIGGKARILAIDRNITDRKAAEEELKAAKLALERQNRELRKLDRMKDALISDVSHELKTPVAKQTMQLEIIKSLISEYGGNDALTRALDVMEATLTRQQNVIRNILMVSRLEGVPESVEVESVRLDTLLEGVMEEFAPVFLQYGIGVTSTLAPLSVRAEKDMLWHVYSNVVGNAVKYRCKEHPVINVLLEARGQFASVVIADNGIGLTDAEKDKAFDRFYQASPAVEGIGLGLNIARIILERCGGGIDIFSDGRGCGARVRTEIPLEAS